MISEFQRVKTERERGERSLRSGLVLSSLFSLHSSLPSHPCLYPLAGRQCNLTRAQHHHCTLGQHAALGQIFNYVDLCETFVFSYAGLMPATRPSNYFSDWSHLSGVLWPPPLLAFIREVTVFSLFKLLILRNSCESHLFISSQLNTNTALFANRWFTFISIPY